MKTRATTRTNSRSGISDAARNRRKGNPAIPQRNRIGVKVKKILVPTDYSRLSCKALAYADRLAELLEAKVTALNVVEPKPSAGTASFARQLASDELTKESKQQLDGHVRQEVKPEILENAWIRYGNPSEEIIDAARAMKADLVIMATHGESNSRQPFLGSTAEHVIRRAPCPVLVVREKEHDFIS